MRSGKPVMRAISPRWSSASDQCLVQQSASLVPELFAARHVIVQALRQRIQPEQTRHELNLIERHAEERENELAERALGPVPPAVEVTACRRDPSCACIRPAFETRASPREIDQSPCAPMPDAWAMA